ncbi:hypothetical protein BDQ12DRAFT_759054 [Crucibulum laeve]|uniref:Uncharacterized protein n=1 Tax=Crucibulum laeve TaxID=68775 RepID=A0A5C3LT34_9AGAR|nr:hypothetical protein BDQ12DRAFT_759054 [Crucibulum laeve]
MTLERTWSGTRATEVSANWSAGPARPFSVTITNLTLNVPPAGPGGTFTGSGSSHGHSFTIRRGRFTDTGSSVKFDIIYNSGIPREKFSGRLQYSDSQLNGTVKVKDPESLPRSYNGYRASISLS